MNEFFDFEYDIGAFIREERKEQGITLKELSEQMKLSVQAISQYELGKRAVKYSTLEKIVSFFDMSVPAFLHKYGLYDEYIPPHFDGDADTYEDFKKEVDGDAYKSMMDSHDNEILKEKFRTAKELFANYGFELRKYVEDSQERVGITETESSTIVVDVPVDEFFSYYDTMLEEIKKFTAYQISKLLAFGHRKINTSAETKNNKEG